MEAYPADDNIVFDGEDTTVKDTWTGYVSDGDAVLAEPEDYINSEVRRMNIKNHNTNRERSCYEETVKDSCLYCFLHWNCFDCFPIFQSLCRKRFMRKVFLI